ncbi:MAG: hypothetical protein H0T76_10905 [Nannocystis sp.]|nr:hypothetical protein [Nannocystis sp.]MBA3546982.1 hypothetical protein [Nannocystis sp.]
MARVVLLTTGAMEEKAFAGSLRRLFPDHEFISKPRFDGFTSARLPPDYETYRERRHLLNLEKFAKEIIGCFAPGGRTDRPRPDFVLALEDVELHNDGEPGNITRALRDAVTHNLGTWKMEGSKADRTREDLRTRCSFHLMAPMTEAYFFADPGAFARATAPGPERRCRLDAATCDVEAFRVEDPEFQATASVPKQHRERHDWRIDERHRHPKSYLGYLTDTKLDGRARYQETVHGVSALAELDWPGVVRRGARATAVARFARSMLADLSDMLETPPVGLEDDELQPADCHPLTWPPPRDRVLRNL